MLSNAHRFRCNAGALVAALVALCLSPAGPAGAGEGGGNLARTGVLKLELDPSFSQFRLDYDDAAIPDRIQLVFDQKTNKPKDACLVGLDPAASSPQALVSLPGSPTTDWGIDTGKFALGSRSGKGTGCGQIEVGEFARLQALGLLLKDARLQVEAKQDASVKVTFKLVAGGTERTIGTRYLLSGNAVNNPPAEVVSACAPQAVSACAPIARVILERNDGGPDSGNNDDGFWILDGAPFHNVEVFEILTNSNGTQGKLSLKGGGEYPDPSNNRSTWDAFEVDGLLDCGDGFSNADGTVTGNRTNEGTCSALIPYDLEFDGEEVRFDTLDTANQGTGFALNVHFNTESAELPIKRTVLSYAAGGVDCTGVDPEGDGPFTESCIGLTVCEGTPIRRCSDGSGCQEDSDCADGSACRLTDMLPPEGGFPDLVASSATLEYGCVCEEDVLYLGPGQCSDGSSCEVDGDCSAGACSLFDPAGDRTVVDQCLFFLGDATFSRKLR